ncbi:MAG: hypothetical protein V4850_10365 [Myxococcota bacterium]
MSEGPFSPRRWGPPVAALAWFVALAAGVTWPAVQNLGSVVIGDDRSGPWRTVWAHVWTLQRLTRDGAWPLDAPEIAFPRGGSFSSIAPVHDALAIPLQLTLGIVPAFNLLVLGHLVLAAVGAWALARAVGLGYGGALVAGTIFGFNSFVLSYGVSSAVVETTTGGWCALFLVAAIRLVRKPSFGSALTAGVAWAVMALSCLYWSVMMAVLAPLFVLAAVLPAAALLRPPPMADVTHLRRGSFVVLGAVFAGALFLPPALALLGTYDAGTGLLAGYADRKQELLDATVMASLAHDYATLVGYLMPGSAALVKHVDLDVLRQSVYAGWVALLLGWIGWGPGTRRWGVLAVVCAVLSLGPFVFLSTTSYRLTAAPWWGLLRDLLPPVRMITSYVRFALFAYLSLGILAGLGVDRLIAAARARWGVRLPLGAVAAGLVIAELATVGPVSLPLPTADATIPDEARALVALPRAGAVLDWPQRYADSRSEVSRYFYWQSVHGRPIPYDFAPSGYLPTAMEANAFYASLEKRTYGRAYDSGAWDEGSNDAVFTGVAEAAADGFAYLSVHASLIAPERREGVFVWLDARLPIVERFEDGSTIYDIGAFAPG